MSQSNLEPGATALCEGCVGELIAKCGEINTWHWAHKNTTLCVGGTKQSQWHLDWKAKFMECDRERRQENKDGKLRIADVRGSGHVYEFQTILPDCEEIRARQKFWIDLGFTFVWVFKSDGKLLAKKLEDGVYRVWYFSKKMEDAALPFYLDDPSSGFCLRVDSFDRVGKTIAEVRGHFMDRNSPDMWIGKPNKDFYDPITTNTD